LKAPPSKPRVFKTRERFIALALGVLGAVACSFSTDGIKFVPDSEFDAAAGKGTAGAGTGGKGSAGAHSAGSNSGGNSDAGSDIGAAGDIESGGTGGLGVAGKGQGGAVNVAGMDTGVGGSLAGGGTAGSGGAPPVTTYPCTGLKPSDKVVADFEKLSQTSLEWKDQAGTGFGVFGFPDPAQSKPILKLGDGTLTIETYTTNSPTGAGIRITPCTDWTGATAIGFTMSGTAKPYIPMMVMRIVTNQNLVADKTTRTGTCVPPTGIDPILACQPSHVDFAMPTVKTSMLFKFSEFSGGKPSERPELDQIKSIEWAFTWLNNQKPFDATLMIDDVVLYYQ
jgi:hypothetical protein